MKVGASITSFSEIVTGSYDGGLKTKIFFFVGLALSFLLVIFLGWISKRAIQKAISQANLQLQENQQQQNEEQTQCEEVGEECFFQNTPFPPTLSTSSTPSTPSTPSSQTVNGPPSPLLQTKSTIQTDPNHQNNETQLYKPEQSKLGYSIQNDQK